MRKDIEDIPGYTIDDNGIVYNTKDKPAHVRVHRGYCFIRGGNKPRKSYPLHRIVAKAFIPNPYNKPMVNHKDRNRLNNSVDNLEWVTNLENNTHWAMEDSKIIDKIESLISNLPEGFLAIDLIPLLKDNTLYMDV